jgi:hypothetical protein
MRTRRSPTLPEHVGALNLIEFEFASDAAVQARWKELFRHFGEQHAHRPDETVTVDLDVEEKTRRELTFSKRLGDERAKLLAKLLHAMAVALRFKVEQLEIFEGGYLPQGWVDQEIQAAGLRQFLVEIYQGKRWLPVGVFDGKSSVAPNVSAEGER